MSGGGHPADVAQGQREHAEGSEKNVHIRPEPTDREGPMAAELNQRAEFCCAPIRSDSILIDRNSLRVNIDAATAPYCLVATRRRPSL